MFTFFNRIKESVCFLKKRDSKRIFIIEIYSKPPQKKYGSKKKPIIILMKHGVSIWQTFQITKSQKLKDVGIHSSYSIVLVNKHSVNL